VRPLSCARVSIGNVLELLCWKWKPYPRVVFRKSRLVWVLFYIWGVCCFRSSIDELLGRKSSGSGLESREYGRRDLSRWPRGTLYPQNVCTNFAEKLLPLVRYRSLADSGHGDWFSFEIALITGMQCVSYEEGTVHILKYFRHRWINEGDFGMPPLCFCVHMPLHSV
jgi:hypothetical protein